MPSRRSTSVPSRSGLPLSTTPCRSAPRHPTQRHPTPLHTPCRRVAFFTIRERVGSPSITFSDRTLCGTSYTPDHHQPHLSTYLFPPSAKPDPRPSAGQGTGYFACGESSATGERIFNPVQFETNAMREQVINTSQVAPSLGSGSGSGSGTGIWWPIPSLWLNTSKSGPTSQKVSVTCQPISNHTSPSGVSR